MNEEPYFDEQGRSPEDRQRQLRIEQAEVASDRIQARLTHIKREGKRTRTPKQSLLKSAENIGSFRCFSDEKLYRVGPRGNLIRVR